MRKTFTVLLVSALTLSACGNLRDSRVNPFNWFGRGESEPVQPNTETAANPLIPQTQDSVFRAAREEHARYKGTPVDRIAELIVERVPGGAILRATGEADVEALFDAQLTPDNPDEVAEDGVLTYRLEALRGADRRISSDQSTRVTVARKVTDQLLAGVRSIRVVGTENAVVVRR